MVENNDARIRAKKDEPAAAPSRPDGDLMPNPCDDVVSEALDPVAGRLQEILNAEERESPGSRCNKPVICPEIPAHCPRVFRCFTCPNGRPAFFPLRRSDMSSQVVLVNEHDEALGTAEKLRAHTEGWLHRALSVFVFDAEGRFLLQKRSPNKYHSGSLWSNTCCSHPIPDESPAAAAHRRLDEEMGFTCSLRPAFHFHYRATVGPNLTEHEYDHVFVGRVERAEIRPDPNEVADWTWMSPTELRDDLETHPDCYTVWFRHIVPSLLTDTSATNAVEPSGEPTGRTPS